jgi:hypothetical protein
VGNPRVINENVIMGRLIPAGTGLPAYKRLSVVIDEKSPTYAPPTFTRGAAGGSRCCRRRVAFSG